MTYSTDWFSKYIVNWERWLSDLKGKPGLHFLEIGCFEGRATVWLLENILTHWTAKIDTIDMFGGGMEDGDKGAYFTEKAFDNYKENITPFNGKVETHIGQSGEILRGFGSIPKYDFIYIDGSHRSPQVLEDSVLSGRLLKVSGIMVWDDYKLKRYPDPLDNPRMAVDAFLSIYKRNYTMIHTGEQVAIQKIL